MDLTAAQRDRAVGAVIGMATGDALGAGYEFQPPNPPDRIAMIGGGSERSNQGVDRRHDDGDSDPGGLGPR